MGVIGVILALVSSEVQAGTSPRAALEAKAATCPELPNVTWWKTTRVKIVRYVDFKYKGNWAPYIQKWQDYKEKMQRILDNNGLALVKSRNIRLQGDELAFHISEIDRRLAVTRCLEGIFSGQLAENNEQSSIVGKETITIQIMYFSNGGKIPISYSICRRNISGPKTGVAVGCDGDGSVIL